MIKFELRFPLNFTVQKGGTQIWYTETFCLIEIQLFTTSFSLTCLLASHL